MNCVSYLTTTELSVSFPLINRELFYTFQDIIKKNVRNGDIA